MVETRSKGKSLSSGDVSQGQSFDDKDDVFHKGVAISMWQNSGDEDSNWTNYIKSKFPFKCLPFGLKRYSGKYSVQETCPDTWNRLVNQQASTGNLDMYEQACSRHAGCCSNVPGSPKSFNMQ